MVRALLDSNILIDHLRGIAAAKEEVARCQPASISIITWIEVMAGAAPDLEDITRALLRSFECISVDAAVAERAVRLRRSRRLKLPDAIILATALERGLVLVTRNIKDFPEDDPAIRVPYLL